MCRKIAVWLVALGVLAALPVSGWAQSSIGGRVRDATGGVLPGVTVEASSPALIEGVRAAVTDGQGLYRIIDLRPGVYTVTFTLAGFGTLRREALEVSANVTLPVNAELTVGDLSETVTVSGASPVVDVQSTTQHQTIGRSQLDDVPTGRQWFNYVMLLPAVKQSTRGQDVGGNLGDQSQALEIHGSARGEMVHDFDGMKWGNMHGAGGGSNGPYPVNNAVIDEVSINTSGAGAEAEVSGMRINIIPKQGGNTFSGTFYGNFSNESLQTSNLDDDLVARGVRTTSTLTKMWDINPAFGGPLKRDSLWFFASYRYFGDTDQPAGAFHDTDPFDNVFIPDVARGPADNPAWTHIVNLRLTWQATQNMKFSGYADNSERCVPCAIGLSSTRPFENSRRLTTPEGRIIQAKWTWAVSSRLLIEAGETMKPDAWFFNRQEIVRDDLSMIEDRGTGIRFRAPTSEIGQVSRQWNGFTSVSYVTGAHSLKVGAQWFHGFRTRNFDSINDTRLYVRNGVPEAVRVESTPYLGAENLNMNFGLYAQEAWTVNRFTLNAGLRFDYMHAEVPEQHLDPVRYVGARDFAAIRNVPNWKDVSPRLGIVWDVFGTSKTALKANLGRYMEGVAGRFPELVNPITSNASDPNRSWDDVNGNFIPDCDFRNLDANGECGPTSNRNFGQPVVSIRYDPAVSEGWGVRGNNWETMIGIEHELTPGMSVEASYHRRWFNNLRVTHNELVLPGDYDPFCVTSPADTRLPGGGGQEVCGLFNITPELRGVSRNVITSASNFGEQTQIFDGVDFLVNARLLDGVAIQGGVSIGRTKTSDCFVVNSPEQLRFCDITPPWQPQIKFSVVYPLPWWDLMTSAAFQSYPGPEVLANWSAPASAVFGLGRPLAGNARSVTVPLIEPGTIYGERLNQLDFRIAKSIDMGGRRLLPQLDLYNAFNGNAVYRHSNTFGGSWLRPTRVLLGRLIKFSIQVDF
jgi:hypothetical protein